MKFLLDENVIRLFELWEPGVFAPIEVHKLED